MRRNQDVSAGGIAILFFVLFSIIIVRQGYVDDPQWFYVLSLSLPLLAASIYFFARKQS